MLLYSIVNPRGATDFSLDPLTDGNRARWPSKKGGQSETRAVKKLSASSLSGQVLLGRRRDSGRGNTTRKERERHAERAGITPSEQGEVKTRPRRTYVSPHLRCARATTRMTPGPAVRLSSAYFLRRKKPTSSRPSAGRHDAASSASA